MEPVEKVKLRFERKYTCSVCNIEYTTPRHSTKCYCSDTCRKSSGRLRTAKKRIAKLPDNAEWGWVASECRRAGSVQALEGHTVESLAQLFALRNYRYKTYGWDAEKGQSKFELCHIQPASGVSSVGLLHPLNLFVGSSLPNRLHGNKAYPGVGLSIPRCQLKPRWLIGEDETNTQVLAKVEKYLGKVLIDYAKAYPIRTDQRLSLARWISKNVPNCEHSLQQLERMKMADLRKIKAEFEGKEVYQMDLTAKRSILVYLDECKRLSEQLPDSQHKEDLAFMVPVLNIAAIWLAGEAGEDGLGSILAVPHRVEWQPLKLRDEAGYSKLRDFIAFQAFQALQGAPVDRKMVNATVRKYLCVGSLQPNWSHVPEGLYKYYQQDFEVFRPQIAEVQNCILSYGLADAIQVHEFLESIKESQAEQEWFESHSWAVGDSEHDYSGMYYEVEDDYTPNPNLKVVRETAFVPF